jgi:hypothetical protein
MTLATIGLDLAKHAFQVHGVSVTNLCEQAFDDDDNASQGVGTCSTKHAGIH